ncbi:beta-fructosidase [Saccharibacillus sp. O23]|uniref:GH32 C-terminal domain-containing protein n=1 Tax=Saccharibacillus sp. O23 TaxID=2009338 RepID=UPI000B4E751B|nr:GH32 C-terminal domain-containing protein [Saccharibacillus sp. O23]OWR30910.1 beta-fructosidase [Saccharibacillus sp. O23]
MKNISKFAALLCAAMMAGSAAAAGGASTVFAEEGGNVLAGKTTNHTAGNDADTQKETKSSTSPEAAASAEAAVWNSNLESVIIDQGSWITDSKGVRGTADADGTPALKVYASPNAETFVFAADLSPKSAAASAGLTFGAGADGRGGYAVWLDRENGRVRAAATGPDGSVLARSDASYPSEDGIRHRLEIRAEQNAVRVFVDGYAEPALELSGLAPGGTAAGLAVRSGEAVFQDTYLTPEEEYYGETYRPAYHYSPQRGSASDPNGMIYYKGEYHLFHQDGGRWAHAVSTDLLHWKSLPIALDWNKLGHIWSGSAIADPDNVSGLFDGSPDGGGLIAYYTSYNPDAPNGNQKIGLAYSSDRGRTWHYSEDRPIVIENPGKNGDDPGGWDFRDPKVVRDEDNGRWIMVVSGGDHIRFFSSTNLTDWTLTDNFGYGEYVRGGVWECPDLFKLPVQGTDESRWVLMISTGANPATQGSDAEYFVGRLTEDGKFVNDNPAGKVLRTDYGKEFYASSSFADAPDGRRIVMAWMTNWDYPFAFPTAGWKGVLSLPRELSLTRTAEGIRLAQAPIEELAALRSELRSIGETTVNGDSPNPLQGLNAGAYEIEAELELPETGAADSFGFRVREGGGQFTDIRYSAAEEKLSLDRSASGIVDYSPLLSLRQEAKLPPESNGNKRIKLRIFVDESTVEVFAADGRTVFSDVIFPGTARRGMSFYAESGQVKIRSLNVYALGSVWKSEEPSRLVADETAIELGPQDSRTVFVSPYLSSSADAIAPTWTSSDLSVVSVSASSGGSAVLRAVGPGRASVTVSAANGFARAIPVTVYGGSFRSDLGALTIVPASAEWIVTEDGLRGGAQGDTTAVSEVKAGDFVYEADVKLDRAGGAASLLFRSDRTGGSAYYLNLDPNMQALRLFYKVGGSFAERQVLARYPAEIRSGGTYRLRVQAEGPRLRAWLDGRPAIDVRDGTFAEGRFGLHAFGGRAAFQNVEVSRAKPAKLRSFPILNESSGRALAAAGKERGSVVGLTTIGSDAPLWTAVPTGSPDCSFSLRTPEGSALDLDVGRSTIQLYDYLGYDNQRWLLRKDTRGTVKIVNVSGGLALTEAADGSLKPEPVRQGNRAQQWKLGH